MSAFSTRLSRFVQQFRWPIIIFNVLIFVVLVAFGMGPRLQEFGAHTEYMKHIRTNPLDVDSNHVSPPPIFNGDYRVFFKGKNKDLIEFDAFQRIFAKEDNLLIVVKAKEGDLFTNENLASLKALTDGSWEVPYITRVAGLTNFNYTTVEREKLDTEEAEEMGYEYEDNLLVEDLVTELPYAPEVLDHKKKIVMTDSLIPKFMISKDAKLTQISLSAIIPAEFPEGFMDSRVAVEALVDDVLSGHIDEKVNVIFTAVTKDSVEFLKSYSKPSWKFWIDDFSDFKAKLDEVLRKNLEKSFVEQVAIAKNSFPNVKINLDAENLMSSNSKLQAKSRTNLDIKLGGTVMLNTSFMEFAFKDMATMIPLMFLLIIVVLVITLRSFWGTVLPMLLLFSSVAFPVMLFVGVFEFYLSNVTMNVMQILVAVAIADSVHVLSVFYRELRKGTLKSDAIRITIQKNFIACLITSVTTSIGFFAMLTQDIPPFQHLGVFAGVGTLYAFYASILTMPALLHVLPIKASKKQIAKSQAKIKKNEEVGGFYKSLEKWVYKYQVSIRWVSIVVMIASAGFVTTIVMDSTAVKYFEKGTEFRSATEYIDENIIGTNPIEFNFKSGEENGVYSPKFLSDIERFTDYIDSHPEFEITYTSSIVDVVKRLNKTMNGDKDEFYTIPNKDSVIAEGDTLSARRLISQYLLLYQLSLPQGMDLNNQLSLDNSQARVTAFIRSISSNAQLDVADSLDNWLEREMPQYKAKATGVPIMFGRLTQIAVPGMMKGLILSLILITATMMITFRSFKVGLFSMIPNIWPVLAIFGAVGASGYVVNLSVSVVGMITLGIAVDDTVHFIVKYLMARKEGKNKEEAISWTYQQVGAPLMFTSIILIFGFGVLMFSQFALNSDMGMFCSAVIALALTADFIILPAFLLKFDNGKLV